jgi:hypothetical protein
MSVGTLHSSIGVYYIGELISVRRRSDPCILLHHAGNGLVPRGRCPPVAVVLCLLDQSRQDPAQFIQQDVACLCTER